MDSLPWHLINEILFRVDLKTLAKLRCTSRSFQSHISNDPYFKSQYFSRLGSGLLHISSYGSRLLCYHSLGDSRSLIKANLMECQILGSCSGLLLISIDSLCVANPLTKKFIFLNHPRSRKFHSRQQVYIEDKKFMGFAVDHVDRTTQSFKIVCMTEKRNANYETVYKFEINAGGSWRLSGTRFTCRTSNLDDSMRSPIYLDGSLHWLRIDGSIVAFNPETEQARLIPINFPKKLSGTTLFSTDGKSLILISATEEVIYVYALENIVTADPKWVLVRRIPNGVLDKKRLLTWNVVAYDGKCLVLREYMQSYDRVVHGYDLRINKWGLMGSIPGWCDANLDFFQFTPSSSSVKGLNKDEQDVILGCEDDERFSSLSSIMGLAINGVDKFVSREENVSFG